MNANKTISNAIKMLAVLALIHAAYAYFKYYVFAWHIPVIAAALWSFGENIKGNRINE